MERFLIFKKNRFKIIDGKFTEVGCRYIDCCLCTAVNNKT